ncbi:MAG: hypothetical protein KDA60_04435 [Planctomycetales bacterium]|nr:hypothetical protein [Planctomycetales bacterium]
MQGPTNPTLRGMSWWMGIASLCALVRPPLAGAHEGPPFPILMDQPAFDSRVSVWADPDIGEARFFVVLEPNEESHANSPLEVNLEVVPTSGRLDPKLYTTTCTDQRSHRQFECHPYFDQRDIWRVTVQLVGPLGRMETLSTEVESTPAGFGVWDLLVYSFPFLFLGGMWAWALLRRWRQTRAPTSK